MYLGPNSLYVNGKQILHDDSGTIHLLLMKSKPNNQTTGSGLLKLDSASGGITSTSSGNIGLISTGTGNVTLTTNSGDSRFNKWKD